jgi:hypothetical protein
VAVDGRHAVDLRGDGHRRVGEAAVAPASEDLARLGLDLLFLAAADVGDDVVEDRVRGDARVARAADGLHGRDVHALHAERALERRQGDGQAHHRAVRVGDDVPLAALALHVDGVEVVRVDLRDQQRDVGGHAVVLGVRDHRAAAVGVVVLRLAGDRGVEAGEEQPRLEVAAQRFHGEAGHVVGHERLETPVGRRAVRLSGAAVGGHHLVHAEPRVIGEELDEALADGAGGAEDGHGDPFGLRGIQLGGDGKCCGHRMGSLAKAILCGVHVSFRRP